MSAAAKPKLEPAVITRVELRELAEWELKLAGAKRLVAEAEKQLYPRRLAIAKKVLGTDLEADYRAMDPQELERLMLRRFDRGLWQYGYGAKTFRFVQTWAGRTPAWKELYIAEAGELAAANAEANTPKRYAYRIEVSTGG